MVDPLDHPAFGTTRLNGSLPGASAPGSPGALDPARPDLAQLEASTGERLRGLTTQVFRHAPFPVLGLDERWTAPRWFGGWQLGDGTDVAECDLAHGHPPVDLEGPLVRVTSRPTPDDDFGPALDALVDEQVEMLFSERGVVVGGDHTIDLRADVAGDDPVRPWQYADILIDGLEVPFRVLGDTELWIGHAVYDGIVVGIEARGWPVGETALRTVRDFGAYESGSRTTMHLRAGSV